MGKEENQQTVLDKQAVLRKLRESEVLFVLLSACTKEPYVNCDQETFDDEIWMYTDLEEAKEAAKKLLGEKIPVGVVKIEKANLLMFYTSLYTMGVNAILVHEKGAKCRIQLTEFVKRRDPSEQPEGKTWVENPELHLTSLYYMQELRRHQNPEMTPRLLELQEEIGADFSKGRYIAALPQEEKGIPLIKMKNEDTFQPLFTDILEFQRFNRSKKFRAVLVEASKVSQILPAEAKGIVLNPLGVNLVLNVKRPVPGQQAAAPQPMSIEKQVEAAMREAELAMQQSMAADSENGPAENEGE